MIYLTAPNVTSTTPVYHNLVEVATNMQYQDGYVIPQTTVIVDVRTTKDGDEAIAQLLEKAGYGSDFWVLEFPEEEKDPGEIPF